VGSPTKNKKERSRIIFDDESKVFIIMRHLIAKSLPKAKRSCTLEENEAVCNDKQQSCTNQRKTDRCRVAQSQPNRELHPNKQPATTSIRTNHGSAYNNRFKKSTNHSTIRPHMARAQAIRPLHLDEQANNDIQ
nr:hypothetical protein [Tanacetum cinerariifolium]